MPTVSSTNEPPLQDDRIMAALAHASILVPFTGLIAPIIIWATQKNKSAYVHFQALQAAVFHITLILAFAAGMACYALSFGAFFGLMLLSPLAESNSKVVLAPIVAVIFGLGLLFPFLVFGIVILIGIGFVLSGLYGAVRCLRGKPFRYFILGRRLERYLQRSPLPPSIDSASSA